MPGGDGTGPTGKGPKTGRGMGPCGEEGSPDVRGAGGKRGSGSGGGRKRRFRGLGRRWWKADMSEGAADEGK
jgi:hypothetical protein